MAYRPGRSARKMYRHKARYGTAGMSKRQLRALRREMDIGVNPRGRRISVKLIRATYGNKLKHTGRFRVRHTRRSRRNPLHCRMSREAMFHELKHHGSRPRSQKQRVAIVLSQERRCGHRNPSKRHRDVIYRGTHMKRPWHQRHSRIARRPMRGLWQQNPVLMNPRSRRNPKRDGTPTRGEKRHVKRGEYLKVLVQRARDAEAKLAKIHGVPASSPAAAREHAPAAAPLLEGGMSAIATLGAVQEVEHAEAKHLRQSLADLTMLIESTKKEADELGEQDEALAEELMEQVAKFARQRQKLKEKATELGIRTNPPRRGQRRHVLVGLRAYHRIIKSARASSRPRR